MFMVLFSDTTVSPNKKKKAPTPVVDHNAISELSAKEKRARRFEREHELERRRGFGFDASPSNTSPPPLHNNLTRKSRLQQTTTFGEGDSVDVTPDLVSLIQDPFAF